MYVPYESNFFLLGVLVFFVIYLSFLEENVAKMWGILYIAACAQ